MTRSRTVRPTFWTSFSLAQVEREVRLFFVGLWTEADDEGRLIDAPKALAGALFPHDPDVDADTVTRWLDELVRVGAIRRYRAKGASYLHIPAWKEHARPPHPTPSKLPAPPADRRNLSRKIPEPVSQPQEKDSTGFGSGLGIGSGSGANPEKVRSDRPNGSAVANGNGSHPKGGRSRVRAGAPPMSAEEREALLGGEG